MGGNKEQLSAEANPVVKRRGLLKFGTLVSAVTGVSAISALGANSANAADSIDATGFVSIATLSAPKQAPTDGTVMAQALAGVRQTVTTSGHSNFYGQGGDGALPGINGQEGANTRSTNNPPDSLKAALDVMWPGRFTLANNTRSGENSRDILGAYANPGLGWTHGNIEFVWLDSNDFFQGIPIDENAANIRSLADEIVAKGSMPVFIGGHFLQDRTATHNRQARADLVSRIAARYGTRYIDIAELQTGMPSVANIWTDGTHMTDAAYGLVGTRLAALMGPKGLHPTRVGPGHKVLPNHQIILGGTVTDRAGAEDGRTILLAAGQTAVIPVDVQTPCDAVVRFFSGTTTEGVGRGRIRYALSKAGIPDRAVNMTPTSIGKPSSTVKGHTYRGGPDLVFITCDTGTLEISGVDFVPVAANLRHSGSTSKTVKSAISGTVLTTPGSGGYATAMDPHTPVSGVLSNGAGSTFRVDFNVTFGGAGASSQALLLVAGQNPDDNWLGIENGVGVRKAGAELRIRLFLPGGKQSDLLTDPTAFPASATWSGIISLVVADGVLQVYKDGVTVGGAYPIPYRHYFPGAYTSSGQLLAVNSCTISAPSACV